MRRHDVTVVEELWLAVGAETWLDCLKLLAEAAKKQRAGYRVTGLGLRFERPVARRQLPAQVEPEGS